MAVGVWSSVVCVWWCFVLSLFLVLCLSFCFVSPFLFFFLTRTSRLAPMAHTLLGGLGHATFQFFVVAARLLLAFCVCPKLYDLAKQRRKVFWGVSEVGKNDFSVYYRRLCVFFLVLFSLLRSRATNGTCFSQVRHTHNALKGCRPRAVQAV